MALDTVTAEVEAALLVYSSHPEAVVEELAALRRLGDYWLQPQPEKQIHDIYFDTPKGELAAQVMSLRLREVNGVPKLTLKGGQIKGETALKVRSELEIDWAEGALSGITLELEKAGIHLETRFLRETWFLESPLTALLVLGLVITQQRITNRLPRKITRDASSEAPPVAEMDIDAVSFHLRERVIRHYEVEIELAEGERPEIARQLAANLQAAFPEKLRPWSLAKLTLGVRVEMLLRQGRLSDHIAADGTLLPGAYQVITQLA